MKVGENDENDGPDNDMVFQPVLEDDCRFGNIQFSYHSSSEEEEEEIETA